MPAGVSGMNVSSNDKVRYALGLFLRVSDLERALKELGAAGFPVHQVKLIAPPGDQDLDSSAWSACGSAFGTETWIVSEASGACPWDFAHVAPQRDDDGAAIVATKRDVMPDFHIWALERHAKQLDRHLRGGGGIAVVRVKTEAEERTIYSTLLHHATAGVQTHDISRHS